ncbi:4a-hydroxytetrahydrobiopterin dehydratase [Patescibacteria group bacterium]|nr:4a-hydroxytetrahydrobiopterin dehydratase [Patescibacteria group bacterium]
MKLSQQKCKPCEGVTSPFSDEEVRHHLEELNQWAIKDDKIHKTFKFSDFKEAMQFVNMVADLAEDEGHHPDIYISYNKVEIILWTHAIKGLTSNDFILAAKIDEKQK